MKKFFLDKRGVASIWFVALAPVLVATMSLVIDFSDQQSDRLLVDRSIVEAASKIGSQALAIGATDEEAQRLVRSILADRLNDRSEVQLEFLFFDERVSEEYPKYDISTVFVTRAIDLSDEKRTAITATAAALKNTAIAPCIVAKGAGLKNKPAVAFTGGGAGLYSFADCNVRVDGTDGPIVAITGSNIVPYPSDAANFPEYCWDLAKEPSGGQNKGMGCDTTYPRIDTGTLETGLAELVSEVFRDTINCDSENNSGLTHSCSFEYCTTQSSASPSSCISHDVFIHLPTNESGKGPDCRGSSCKNVALSGKLDPGIHIFRNVDVEIVDQISGDGVLLMVDGSVNFSTTVSNQSSTLGSTRAALSGIPFEGLGKVTIASIGESPQFNFGNSHIDGILYAPSASLSFDSFNENDLETTCTFVVANSFNIQTGNKRNNFRSCFAGDPQDFEVNILFSE